MASNASAFFCAMLALVLWTSVGWVLGRRLALGPTLVLPLAPALGWAVQNVVALALSIAIGFSALAIVGATLLLYVAVTRLVPLAPSEIGKPAGMPRWVYGAAALLALAPTAATLPKFVGDGVILAAPIFDHAKVALIDEMVRNGVPPANPVFGEGGGASSVAYYYLWHFGAAQLARLTGASGWEADIACTWFTAFASLSLMCGIAFYFCGRVLSALLVLAFCATGSLRPVLETLVGEQRLGQILNPASGFAGWLFQISWSPHHVAAASCVLIATLVMARLARHPNVFGTLMLTLVVAAGFESSLWVGGVAFALSGGAAGLALLWAACAKQRFVFLLTCCTAALGAAIFSSPLIVEQLHAAAARGGSSPVIINFFPVLGPLLPNSLRHMLDVPAYWLVLLAIEFPVVFIPGALALGRLALSDGQEAERKLTVIALAALATASFCCSWLLLSTVGYNNDLGWRAVLPGVLILTAAAAAGAAQWLSRLVSVAAATMLAAVALALPDGARIMAANVTGDVTSSSTVFADAPAMWAAVRKYAPKDARVANNPLFLQDMTPWPVNISWALLADRRSCFAGNELAIAFAPLPADRRQEISGLFIRAFDGTGTADDVARLTEVYGCRVALVTAEDGAWTRDPFATSPLYRLAEAEQNKWRIYVVIDRSNP